MTTLNKAQKAIEKAYYLLTEVEKVKESSTGFITIEYDKKKMEKAMKALKPFLPVE